VKDTKSRDGYYVEKLDGTRRFSKYPLEYKTALAQLRALELSGSGIGDDTAEVMQDIARVHAPILSPEIQHIMELYGDYSACAFEVGINYVTLELIGDGKKVYIMTYKDVVPMFEKINTFKRKQPFRIGTIRKLKLDIILNRLIYKLGGNLYTVSKMEYIIAFLHSCDIFDMDKFIEYGETQPGITLNPIGAMPTYFGFN
jgi:hypothetical protein